MFWFLILRSTTAAFFYYGLLYWSEIRVNRTEQKHSYLSSLGAAAGRWQPLHLKDRPTQRPATLSSLTQILSVSRSSESLWCQSQCQISHVTALANNIPIQEISCRANDHDMKLMFLGLSSTHRLDQQSHSDPQSLSWPCRPPPRTGFTERQHTSPPSDMNRPQPLPGGAQLTDLSRETFLKTTCLGLMAADWSHDLQHRWQ